jgi:hypothetical protein
MRARRDRQRADLGSGTRGETVTDGDTMSKQTDDVTIRPFHVEFAQEEIDDLRRRVAATRWPEQETVADGSQGVPLALMQELARYWAREYDWRKCEAKLNALPQFLTEIDGLDIRFLHVRSPREDALPLIVTHGWPGSIIEQLKIIEPLTKPTAHGASAEDAFHLVIPSLPGHGFSAKHPQTMYGLADSPIDLAEFAIDHGDGTGQSGIIGGLGAAAGLRGRDARVVPIAALIRA